MSFWYFLLSRIRFMSVFVGDCYHTNKFVRLIINSFAVGRRSGVIFYECFIWCITGLMILGSWVLWIDFRINDSLSFCIAKSEYSKFTEVYSKIWKVCEVDRKGLISWVCFITGTGEDVICSIFLNKIFVIDYFNEIW